MVIALELAGLAASTHSYSAPNAPEPKASAASEGGGRACLIDYDTPCSVLGWPPDKQPLPAGWSSDPYSQIISCQISSCAGSQGLNRFISGRPPRAHIRRVVNRPSGPQRTEGAMNRFVMLVAAGMVVLDVFAPVVRAQDYVVNGHAATKAEAQLLTLTAPQPASGGSTGMASRGLSMSPRPEWCRSPARSAGTCSTSSFAIDLSRRAGSCRQAAIHPVRLRSRGSFGGDRMDTLISVPLGNPIRAGSRLGTGAVQGARKRAVCAALRAGHGTARCPIPVHEYSATPRQARLLGVAGDGGTGRLFARVDDQAVLGHGGQRLGVLRVAVIDIWGDHHPAIGDLGDMKQHPADCDPLVAAGARR